jgi:hypothetical protein
MSEVRPAKSQPARRPYSTPTLRTYGDAVALTQGKSAQGNHADGGSSKLRTK